MTQRIPFTPLDGRVFPRFAGIRTFYRLPELTDTAALDAADVAILGAPFDGGTSFRPGARFGPERIRMMSTLGRGHHPAHDVHLFKALKVGDAGDTPVTPQDIDASHRQIQQSVAHLLAHDCIPMVFGGDHSTTIGTMQAIFDKHGPFGVVHFDAHTDTYPAAWGCDVHHGTFMRIGHERGWFRDGDTVSIGIRGPFSTEQDIQDPVSMGIDVVTTDDVRLRGLDRVKKIIKEVGPGPVFVTFDVDSLDPAYAPGTGTPVPGGLSTWEAFQMIRATADLQVVGADVVEVSPPYDNNDITSLVAVTVGWEIMTAIAKYRQTRSA